MGTRPCVYYGMGTRSCVYRGIGVLSGLTGAEQEPGADCDVNREEGRCRSPVGQTHALTRDRTCARESQWVERGRALLAGWRGGRALAASEGRRGAKGHRSGRAPGRTRASGSRPLAGRKPMSTVGVFQSSDWVFATFRLGD
ncbi:hypothetical protein scyTo_0010681 [Scyliorhinus torazame]|uniref:Uncharacterized protein n=1 Tax=Scyliorhinus torazame TaxID=75743 RepID=A0A401PA78_SCYTO|nr:hypothetical protein [Scyliorhinus torazame]